MSNSNSVSSCVELSTARVGDVVKMWVGCNIATFTIVTRIIDQDGYIEAVGSDGNTYGLGHPSDKSTLPGTFPTEAIYDDSDEDNTVEFYGMTECQINELLAGR